MTITYNMLEVQVDLSRIVDNYRFIRSKAAKLMPVIKADAYGHGLLPVARALVTAGADAFCVGSVTEAVTLRREGTLDSGVRVVSLLGPVDQEDYVEAVANDVTLLVGRLEQLERLQTAAAGAGRMARLALKFDTGMSRLGFSETDVPRIIQILAASPNLRLELVTSHLATADEDSSVDYVQTQAKRFCAITGRLSAAGLRFKANLANSAGILGFPELHFDLQRPGIALYGSNPFLGTSREELGRPLKQAMSVTTRILDVHDLPRGGTISYGRTYTASRDMRVAIMAAGYADGYSRGLSNGGQVCLKGSRASILGRVCMQLTAVDITGREDVRPGDTVHLLGGHGEGHISAEELAGWWGTISYEVFCILGLNRRVYLEG